MVKKSQTRSGNPKHTYFFFGPISVFLCLDLQTVVRPAVRTAQLKPLSGGLEMKIDEGRNLL